MGENEKEEGQKMKRRWLVILGGVVLFMVIIGISARTGKKGVKER